MIVMMTEMTYDGGADDASCRFCSFSGAHTCLGANPISTMHIFKTERVHSGLNKTGLDAYSAITETRNANKKRSPSIGFFGAQNWVFWGSIP